MPRCVTAFVRSDPTSRTNGAGQPPRRLLPRTQAVPPDRAASFAHHQTARRVSVQDLRSPCPESTPAANRHGPAPPRGEASGDLSHHAALPPTHGDVRSRPTAYIGIPHRFVAPAQVGGAGTRGWKPFTGRQSEPLEYMENFAHKLKKFTEIHTLTKIIYSKNVTLQILISFFSNAGIILAGTGNAASRHSRN